jgi:hypothetical protein
MDIKWIQTGKVYTGSFCTIQGKSRCAFTTWRIDQFAFARFISSSRRGCRRSHYFSKLLRAITVKSHINFMMQAIAVHTSVTFWWGKGLNNLLIPSIVVAASFLFGLLSIAIGISRFHSSEHPFQSPTPARCQMFVTTTAESH